MKTNTRIAEQPGSEPQNAGSKGTGSVGLRMEEPLFWPMILIFSRLILALVFQLAVTGIYAYRGNAYPLETAGRWFTVYGTLIDAGCLYLISRQIRKDNRTLFDLVNARGIPWQKTVATAVGYILIFFPLSMVGMSVSSFLFLGSWIPQEIMGGIPLWGAIYSVTIWPIVWAFAEQITYQGFALPRLLDHFEQRWKAIAWVSFGWAIQHAALPLQLDVGYMAMRTASFLPVAIGMTCLFSRSKRLLPFIIAHWVMDLTAALSGTLLPFLR